MGDMLGYAVGVLGLSPFIFYELTPVELTAIVKQYQDAEQDKMDMFGMTVHYAIGTALNGKKYKAIFGGKRESEKVHKSTLEDRQNTMDYFKDKFDI